MYNYHHFIHYFSKFLIKKLNQSFTSPLLYYTDITHRHWKIFELIHLSSIYIVNSFVRKKVYLLTFFTFYLFPMPFFAYPLLSLSPSSHSLSLFYFLSCCLLSFSSDLLYLSFAFSFFCLFLCLLRCFLAFFFFLFCLSSIIFPLLFFIFLHMCVLLLLLSYSSFLYFLPFHFLSTFSAYFSTFFFLFCFSYFVLFFYFL